MKRPFALIGLTYLSVLAVVFYFFSTALIVGITITAVCLIFAAVLIKPLKNKKIKYLVFAVSALTACLSYIFYSVFIYIPIFENYYGSNVEVSGYICDEVEKSYGTYIYTVCTDEIDGKSDKIKILVYSYENFKIEEFDEINARIKIIGDTSSSYKSRKIFLQGDCDEFSVTPTGYQRKNLYYYAVKVRTTMKNALDKVLPYEYSSMCKAVLLGDKKALSDTVKQDIYKTGTSHLFVVSGLHLSVIVGFVIALIKKFTENRFIICLISSFSAFTFMAVTGFSPSVIRAGVTLILAQCASVALRNADPLNSLGVSALVLSLFNPYAVGDIGMICSFVATAGIIVWGNSLSEFITGKIKIKLFVPLIEAVSVSVSATLWVLPISFIGFGRISPFAPIVSVLAEPFVSIIIVSSLFCAVFFICPFISFLAYPFGLTSGLCCKFVIWLEHIFALIPCSSLDSSRPFLSVWLICTFILVVIGFFIKKQRPFYVKCASLLSCLIFIGGWAVNSVIDFNNPKLSVWDSGKGITATLENGSSVSFLSCGGYAAKSYAIVEEIGKTYDEVDNLVIMSDKSNYSGYKSNIVNEFRVSNILLYCEEKADSLNLKSQNLYEYKANESFSLSLGSKVIAEIQNIDGITYQLIKKDSVSVLIIPKDGDIERLSEKYRCADVIITDGLPNNFKLLDCKNVIFTGDEANFSKYYKTLSSVGQTVINASRKIDISMKSGGVYVKDN